MKVVINKCFGGEFGLSDKAKKKLVANSAYSTTLSISTATIPSSLRLLKNLARKQMVVLLCKVVEIPDDVRWKITDYDGIEQIEEIHRVWR